ncbi:class I lanthipeptide [Chitinophaga sp. HK235]|uniref:class I lanthipeptide n=1 Tax=Chitinophaga sp. HK235 TaxID=2952571 RepID=UPI001BAA0518|nr:class I lanthipeptide [Chitinophaga sp. HK235]
MKKTKIKLSKKLYLKKNAIVELNPEQQSKIAGGMPLTRTTICCVPSDVSHCEVC